MSDKKLWNMEELKSEVNSRIYTSAFRNAYQEARQTPFEFILAQWLINAKNNVANGIAEAASDQEPKRIQEADIIKNPDHLPQDEILDVIRDLGPKYIETTDSVPFREMINTAEVQWRHREMTEKTRPLANRLYIHLKRMERDDRYRNRNKNYAS